MIVTTANKSDVFIWYRSTTSLDEKAVKSAEQHLSIEERSRRDRLRFAADRRDLTIAHDLLRRTLSRYADLSPADWRFTTNQYGKPSIENIDPQVRKLSFSISHTRGCVACAITSNAALGIDVERIDQPLRVQEIADQHFSKEETASLRQYAEETQNIRFVELWTLKEAFVKAIGVGLSIPLTFVSFRFDERARIEFSGPSAIDSHDWHFALFEPVCKTRLGVAIRSVERPRFFLHQDPDNGFALAPVRTST